MLVMRREGWISSRGLSLCRNFWNSNILENRDGICLICKSSPAFWALKSKRCNSQKELMKRRAGVKILISIYLRG